MELLQLRADYRAAEIVRDQTPHDAGLDDVLPHPCESGLGGLEVHRQHVPGRDAVFHHFDEAHVGGEDGKDLGPVHSGKEEGRVGHLAKHREELRREHVAISRHERDDHPIRAAELVAVLEESAHVLVLERHQLGESRVDPESRREPGHREGGQREGRDHQAAAAKEQTLEAGAHDSRSPVRGCRCPDDMRSHHLKPTPCGVDRRVRGVPGTSKTGRTCLPGTGKPALRGGRGGHRLATSSCPDAALRTLRSGAPRPPPGAARSRPLRARAGAPRTHGVPRRRR